MKVPVIIEGKCFQIVDNTICVYAYETDSKGTVVRASVIRIHVNSPLSKLREKYAAKQNIFPHEIDMFFNDKEIFDDETCNKVGIEHEEIVRMQVTYDTIHSKDEEGEENKS